MDNRLCNFIYSISNLMNFTKTLSPHILHRISPACDLKRIQIELERPVERKNVRSQNMIEPMKQQC